MKKILIANRGEIACRIMATCHEMGLGTVAVYSEADRGARHVLKADEAVYLGASDPGQSYLHMDRIIDAARRTGAEAIHPGYGFLSENGDFAEAVEGAGLVFIGPPSSVIRALGDKTAARRTVGQAGVPIIPGMSAAEADPDVLLREALEIGFPVLIKAAAGGGGKGMRVVDSVKDFRGACLAATSEAKSAFGDGSIYLEKYLDRPRHIEFQILADQKGNVVHLRERECSIQRRHQKIIEETPSPVMTEALRERMGRAAVAVARASGYVNAGTVEFLLDQSGRFYFLEVNARLQVEHPITELITGLDLVRLQLEIAAGRDLPFTQDDIVGRGHAIECRIYAEDPENGFMPCPGRVVHLETPSGPGFRNDCGIYSGFEVPVEYDPILSKFSVQAETRDMAIERMIRGLREYVILGLKTPIPFLIDVLGSREFRAGHTFTDFIETHFADWKPNHGDKDLAALAFIARELAGPVERTAGPGENGVKTPWQTLGSWGR